MLGLRFCARAFSSCGERGPLFIAVRGPLSVAASPVAEHRLQMRRLSSCGSRAQLLRGMWDPPRPGLEPVSPALAGRLSNTAPPGKPKTSILWCSLVLWARNLDMAQLGTVFPDPCYQLGTLEGWFSGWMLESHGSILTCTSGDWCRLSARGWAGLLPKHLQKAPPGGPFYVDNFGLHYSLVAEFQDVSKTVIRKGWG